ncbi:hypothetical protein LOM8899_01395 [Flavimaricola marinus]|uniref:Uncharacterized protein n=1 Tax=Flavimaricola marinus TaxID=1819565 RepID=A0A238LCF7_9RHOB|nr:hypothetical protein LOM8899_01395 [Flavimaricola marinus]
MGGGSKLLRLRGFKPSYQVVPREGWRMRLSPRGMTGARLSGS